MQTFLHIVWILFPAFFFVMALWAKLEQFSKSARKQNPGDFFKQGLFIAACSLLAFIIDLNFLRSFNDSFVPFLPLLLLQIVLYPFILLIGAKLLGPSKDILVGRPNKDNAVKVKNRWRK